MNGFKFATKQTRAFKRVVIFLIHPSKKGSTLNCFHPNKWDKWYFVTV